MRLSNLVAAILLTAVCIGDGLGYVYEINWNPVEPIEGDEVSVTILGFWPTVQYLHSEFERQEFELQAVLNLRPLGFQMGTRYEANHEWGELPAGEYHLSIQLNIENGEVFFYEDDLTVHNPDLDHQLILSRGWNMIGMPILINSSIPDLFHELAEEGSLNLVKDGQGRFYSPEQNFNNLPDFDFRNGYLVKMNEPGILELEGRAIDPNSSLQLLDGWNLVPYLSGRDENAAIAFRNLGETLILAKDGTGRFYLPSQNFDNMSPVRTWCGYLVKVNGDIEFQWGE